jgi:dUTP pyrophosphatase
MLLKVKKLHSEAKIPDKNNASDSGYDFFIVKDGDFDGEVFVLETGKRKVFSTGISLELPAGYGMLMKDRSSMAVCEGLHVIAGVIDNGYRGEIKICFVNLSGGPCVFTKGQKVAQGVLHPIPICDVEEIEELSETERGNKGFGSSGSS